MRAGIAYSSTDIGRGDVEDYGPVASLALGMKLPHNFRGEVEYGYRFKDADKVKGAKAKFHAHTLMLNGYYDFKNTTAFTPFVGLGVGVAYWDLRAKLTGQKVYDKDGFDYALNAMGGVSYALNQNFEIEGMVKYTYMGAARGSNNVDGILGLRYNF